LKRSALRPCQSVSDHPQRDRLARGGCVAERGAPQSSVLCCRSGRIHPKRAAPDGSMPGRKSRPNIPAGGSELLALSSLFAGYPSFTDLPRWRRTVGTDCRRSEASVGRPLADPQVAPRFCARYAQGAGTSRICEQLGWGLSAAPRSVPAICAEGGHGRRSRERRAATAEAVTPVRRKPVARPWFQYRAGLRARVGALYA